MYSLAEINSSPVFAPIGHETEFIARINKDQVMKDLLGWFKDPYMLSTIKKQSGGMSGGGMGLFNFETHLHRGAEFSLEDPENRKIFDKHVNPKEKQRILDGLKDGVDHYGVKTTHTLHIDRRYHDQFNKVDVVGLEIKTTRIAQKGEKLSKYEKAHLLPFVSHKDSPLSHVVKCFNIVEKEFKLVQESKRDFYRKYFTTKPFFAFEETGIEVFFARKGYAIDGKRLPSFNRGSVYGLRLSLKLNNIKQKGLTKKDDMIKVLMKL